MHQLLVSRAGRNDDGGRRDRRRVSRRQLRCAATGGARATAIASPPAKSRRGAKSWHFVLPNHPLQPCWEGITADGTRFCAGSSLSGSSRVAISCSSAAHLGAPASGQLPRCLSAPAESPALAAFRSWQARPLSSLTRPGPWTRRRWCGPSRTLASRPSRSRPSPPGPPGPRPASL